MGKIICLILISLLIFTSGCNNFPVQRASSESTATATGNHGDNEPAEIPESHSVESAPQPVPEYGRQEILEMGTGQYTANQELKTSGTAIDKNGDITLNFQEADLREFIKAVLGDILGENYLIDTRVGGKVTIETPSPITRDNLFPLFEEILSVNNAAVIKSDGFYHIVPKDQAVRGNIAPSVIQSGVRSGYSVRVIPLQFIAAQEMQKILEPFVSEKGNLRADVKRNLLIASGTEQELDLIQQTIALFDVDWMRGMSMGLYPLDYVDPKTLKTELDSIIGAVDVDSTKELLGGLVRIVPIERLNSILVIGSTASALREVEIWIHRLDRQGSSSGQRLYVYNVQNAKAVELADILGQVFRGSEGKLSSKQRQVQLAPGLSPVEIKSGETPGSRQAAAASTGTSTGEGVVLPSGGAIEIIADHSAA